MQAMADGYDFRSIERKWQDRWERDGIYRATFDGARPKYYVCAMLPYPSGDLHVGHAKNYTLGDAIARMMRMLGYNVLNLDHEVGKRLVDRTPDGLQGLNTLLLVDVNDEV